MKKLTEKILEAKRRELMMNKVEFSEWLGFTSNAQARSRSLVSQYFELRRFLAGDEGYYAGPKTLRRVTERLNRNI